jgi:peptidoglycan/xylan/chitin deacetylase (PgdA/CDA1 family)
MAEPMVNPLVDPIAADAAHPASAQTRATGDTPATRTLGADVLILMYHHCAPPPRDARVPGLYVTPEQFAWQLDWLRARGASFATFADFDNRDVTADSHAPQVIVTFDDGFRDVYERAWPVLQARRIPAVVFPVVGDIGKTGVVWPENTDRAPQTLMTAEQIREMQAGGCEFGSHLWDHRRASGMSAAELSEQLRRSHGGLAAITGRAPLSIAYPFGAYTPQVVDATAAAGYRYAVTTETGSNRGAPLLELRRIGVKGTRFHHRWRFARALSRALASARQAVSA